MSQQFHRLRALACRYWSVAPPQFDEWVAEGKINFVDVMEMVKLLCHDPLTSLWIYEYLWPDKAAAEAARKKAEQEAEEERQRQERWKITGMRMIAMARKSQPENEKLKAWSDRLATEGDQ